MLRSNSPVEGKSNVQSDLLTDYAFELKPTVRLTGLISGVLILFLFPFWSLFDAALVPSQVDLFFRLRLIGLIPISALLLLLWLHPWGRRFPEVLSFLIMLIPELFIAYMLPNVGSALPAYLLGYSMVIYGSVFLMVWRLPWVIGLISSVVVAAFLSFAFSSSFTMMNFSILSFHLLSSSAVSIAAAWVHHRTRFSEFVMKRDLLQEKGLTNKLLEKLEHRSKHDVLTGLANRRHWRELLERYWKSDQALAVAFIDIDFFKQVNDTYGHHLGDEVLIAISDVLRSASTEHDLPARLGGDELAVLFRSGSFESVEFTCRKIVEKVRELRFDSAPKLRVSVSVGLAFRDDFDDDSSALMHRADEQVYKAKVSRDVLVVDIPHAPSSGIN